MTLQTYNILHHPSGLLLFSGSYAPRPQKNFCVKNFSNIFYLLLVQAELILTSSATNKCVNTLPAIVGCLCHF